HADPRLAGVFLGTSIHDTAQVTGAGLIYQQQFRAPAALNAAAVVKLVRNLFMAGGVTLMGPVFHPGRPPNPAGRAPWHPVVPCVVLGFLGMAALRSLGDLSSRPLLILDSASWKALLGNADTLSSWCLTIAMASVGLGTGLAKLKGLGLKPFCVGL